MKDFLYMCLAADNAADNPIYYFLAAAGATILIVVARFVFNKWRKSRRRMKPAKESRHIFSKVMIGLTLLFFYLPILYIIIFSFNSSRSLTSLDGFSLRWYEKMLNDPVMMDSIYYTIIIAVVATAAATVLGTVTAIGLSKCGKLLRSTVERVNELPIMNPDIVTGISLLMLFAAIAIPKGFVTMLLAHIMFCTPFVILSVMPKLRTLDPNLTDAALDLGATPMQAMTKVIIPQIRPSIIAGALIAFTMSFDDFVISYFVTGNGVQNISIVVYTMSKRINPSINALSTLVIVIITVALLTINILPVIRDKALKLKNNRKEQQKLPHDSTVKLKQKSENVAKA